MNPRTLFSRVAAMDRAELRFRVECEARKAAAHARFGLARPAWQRRSLVRILAPSAGPLVAEARHAARRGDFLGAHRALDRHFASRRRRWPIAAGARAALVDAIRQRFPSAAVEARDRADRIVDGRFDLLGYRALALGNPPDWHADTVNRRRAPRGFWTTVPFLSPSAGDHKVIWEANRHQHFLLLGAAWWLSALPRFRDTFIAHLQDWLLANPPLDGVNWTSMLELAFRALSWTWAIEFFCSGAEQDDTPWLVDLLVALDRQLSHVEQNLSTYFSPNTHITGEALALYAVSRALPELAASRGRGDHGRAILLREADAQVLPDGGHAERSSHYHRYSTDFYLLAYQVATLTEDASALDGFARAASAQAKYLRTIADDRGRLPHLGDDDGGQLFRFGGAAPADASPSLAAAAYLLDYPSLAVDPPTPEVYWILGGAPPTAPGAPAPWGSRVLGDSGYVVLRGPEAGQLTLDGGAHGFLNGGHAHADALSVVLNVQGLPLLVDPGTATYTMDPALRDRFRAPDMHNTVTIDGRPFAEPRGPFHWQRTTDARILAARVDADAAFAVATHAGYGFPLIRAVVLVRGAGWLIVDYAVTAHPVRAEAWWHLHPSWSAAVTTGGFLLTHASGARVGMATTAPECTMASAPYSPEYGVVESAPVLRTGIGANRERVLVGTFVPARANAAFPDIAVTAAPAAEADGWTTVRFAIAAERDVHVVLALPGVPEAQPRNDWPQPCIQETRAVCVE
jgi:hypothetical protein